MFWCRCDPPSIPYLGIYLSDLTFIDEGTPNFTEKGLLNFAKMRMVFVFDISKLFEAKNRILEMWGMESLLLIGDIRGCSFISSFHFGLSCTPTPLPHSVI